MLTGHNHFLFHVLKATHPPQPTGDDNLQMQEKGLPVPIKDIQINKDKNCRES